MFNKDFNPESLRHGYTQFGAGLIHNILQPDYARSLYEVLCDVSWSLEISGQNSSDVIHLALPDPRYNADNPLQVLAELGSDLNSADVFYVRLIHDSSSFENQLLKEFETWLNSDDFIGPMKILTGRNNVVRSSISATCYQRNCFLNSHRDDHDPTNSVALIFNLTPTWQLDWGGMLIVSPPGQTPTIIPPTWNSLSLMNVPVDHLVSSVSPVATGMRYAMTGWLHHT